MHCDCLCVSSRIIISPSFLIISESTHFKTFYYFLIFAIIALQQFLIIVYLHFITEIILTYFVILVEIRFFWGKKCDIV